MRNLISWSWPRNQTPHTDAYQRLNNTIAQKKDYIKGYTPIRNLVMTKKQNGEKANSGTIAWLDRSISIMKEMNKNPALQKEIASRATSKEKYHAKT